MFLIFSESTKIQLEASVLLGWQENLNNNNGTITISIMTETFPRRVSITQKHQSSRELLPNHHGHLSAVHVGFLLHNFWLCAMMRQRN